jgi:hypothetical protein
VRYSVALTVLPSIYSCHCQRWSGSAFSQQAVVPEWPEAPDPSASLIIVASDCIRVRNVSAKFGGEDDALLLTDANECALLPPPPDLKSVALLHETSAFDN